MRRLSYLLAANQDLAGIARYITRESGSVAVSKAFVVRLHDKCTKLAALPGTLGQARPELGADIRSTSFQNYTIFFRYRDDMLEIVNVLEAHRDTDTLFRK